MNYLKLGLIKEHKTPPDKRVALLPAQCLELKEKYPFLQINIESSNSRCVPDEDYTALGLNVTNDITDCDLLLGIKEVPPEKLLDGKTYLFFSHTIKKQPHNRKLLQTILEKNIKLIDYECLTDKYNNRIVAFGRYAGIVGAYNGLMAYGLRYQLFNLKPAHLCHSMAEMISEQYPKIASLPPIKIVVTGNGRVGKGAKEVLDGMKIKQVSAADFLNQEFDVPVYAQLNSGDYYTRSDGQPWDSSYFHANPAAVSSIFEKFATVADMLITTSFWHPATPPLFTLTQMQKPDFRLKIIADITCDIEGFVPCTLKASTIAEPFFDYNPQTKSEEKAFSSEKNITMMSIDNLPCELPYDASFSFGRQLIDNVFPHLLLNPDTDSTIEKAAIAENGKLNPRYEYLDDYIHSK